MQVKNTNKEIKTVVRLAIKPDKEQENKIAKIVANLGGSEENTKFVIDEEVLGGIQIRVGDFLYDATIGYQLNELVLRLRENK